MCMWVCFFSVCDGLANADAGGAWDGARDGDGVGDVPTTPLGPATSACPAHARLGDSHLTDVEWRGVRHSEFPDTAIKLDDKSKADSGCAC
jgi:hypothetical protein